MVGDGDRVAVTVMVETNDADRLADEDTLKVDVIDRVLVEFSVDVAEVDRVTEGLWDLVPFCVIVTVVDTVRDVFFVCVPPV